VIPMIPQKENDCHEDDSAEEDEDDEEDEEVTATKDTWEDQAALYYIKRAPITTPYCQGCQPCSKREIKRIERRAASYQWDQQNGTLYKRPSGRYESVRICPPMQDSSNIISELHSELGHVGNARLCSIINTRYWWPGITQQVRTAVKSCVSCLRNRALFRQEVPLHPLPLPHGLFERSHLDSAGPYPTSRSGNRYLYLAVDATSKFPMAMAAPRLSSTDFAAFFMLHCVAQHGVPAVCVHDSGPEFGEPWPSCLRELRHSRSAVLALTTPTPTARQKALSSRCYMPCNA